MLRNLLWVDCAAGAAVGVLVLGLASWLAEIEGLPLGVLLFTGAANLLYACYSFSLAIRIRRRMIWIKLLVLANLAWVPVCIGLAWVHRADASPLGFAHLLGEAAFVGGLAVLEWKQRHQLVRPQAN
ncbi:hypothetical protein ABI59_00240 [Acidobacteria bacterium Mor1]|nr:hypothetical protein ABI59_00240 [Acidobacteria bacterium Mor1]